MAVYHSEPTLSGWGGNSFIALKYICSPPCWLAITHDLCTNQEEQTITIPRKAHPIQSTKVCSDLKIHGFSTGPSQATLAPAVAHQPWISGVMNQPADPGSVALLHQFDPPVWPTSKHWTRHFSHPYYRTVSSNDPTADEPWTDRYQHSTII